MMNAAIKRLLLLLLLFSNVAYIVSAAHPKDDADSTSTAKRAGNSATERLISTSPSIPETTSGKEQQGHGGEAQVQEALAILQGLESPRSRLSRSDRSPSLARAVAYYAKELFVLLFMNRPPQDDTHGTKNEDPRLSQPLAEAIKLLEGAAEENNPDAIYLLGEINFYGNFSYPRNYPEAFRRYYKLSALTGNSSAQYMVGFMYATGIGGAVQQDQAKALLYHTFAALGGDTRSEMTVAFRHHTGIATPRNCDEAAYYYKRVADKAIQYSRSGPPGGRSIPRHAYRLAEDEGGVYGEGASSSSSGANAKGGGPASDSHAAVDDVLEYLDLLSRKGDLRATLSLGRLYYDGSRQLRRNFKRARTHFMNVAKKYWTREGKVITSGNKEIEKFAGKAAGFLGRIYLRGDGVEQSFERALTWFKRGLASGDVLSQNGLGLMYLHGYGVPKDALKAADYFRAAAEQDFAPAQVNLGSLFLDQSDVDIAFKYFEKAARYGNIEAYYYLAQMHDKGVGRERSCGIATAYYKSISEKVEAIHSSFEASNEAYEDGDLETALVGYMMAAEQGYESAQANVAFLLDQQKSRLPLTALKPLLFFKQRQAPILQNPELALIYWTRSAKQSNVDSMVKMGDYYLDGIGTEPNAEKAASCYQSAAEDHQESAQALWNLGWMHENGIGVDQDFHLAKRYYDLAFATNHEAYLPATLSLLKLRMRSFWNTITNGRINSIRSEPAPKKEWSFKEWINNFFNSDHLYYRDEDDSLTDTHTYDPMPGSDDFYDEVIEDGLFETLIIIGLAAGLAFLIYYRQQRQLLHARAVQQRQVNGAHGAGAPAQGGQGAQNGAAPANDEDRGFFPNAGEPEFQQWLAGGIGH